MKNLHKNQIKIRDFQGYEIYYAHRGMPWILITQSFRLNRLEVVQFITYKDDKKRVVSAKTEAELEVKIQIFERNKRKFKPLKVIKVDEEKEGKITSRDAQYPDDPVRWSYPTGESYRGKPTYGHCSVIVETYRGSYNFVEATAKNLEILNKIKYQRKKQAALEDDIGKLKEGFEKPITFERLEKQETRQQNEGNIVLFS